MTRIRWIKQMNRYFVQFEDGSVGWCSDRGAERLFPDRDWDIVKKNDGQIFYL